MRFEFLKRRTHGVHEIKNRIRVLKGGSQLSGWQIAQNRVYFVPLDENRLGFVQFASKKLKATF